MTTVEDVLHQFELDLDLPKEILDLSVGGTYTEVTEKTQIAPFKTKSGKLSMKPFDVFEFKGGVDLLLISPENTFQTVSICKSFRGNAVGDVYDNKGNISAKL
ncbi:hypothetical protein [uncultured Methanobrevibacter sp.]|uniref:hypothetical protein n=1 Tax=uncultured Methanobrevibacter sp. TaxID=253161 RepID=UPI0025F73EB2|nr:hypothetical protein [uncultured Methanobrevibacter sp.]